MYMYTFIGASRGGVGRSPSTALKSHYLKCKCTHFMFCYAQGPALGYCVAIAAGTSYVRGRARVGRVLRMLRTTTPPANAHVYEDVYEDTIL
jgi:hypothetical protein